MILQFTLYWSEDMIKFCSYRSAGYVTVEISTNLYTQTIVTQRITLQRRGKSCLMTHYYIYIIVEHLYRYRVEAVYILVWVNDKGNRESENGYSLSLYSQTLPEAGVCVMKRDKEDWVAPVPSCLTTSQPPRTPQCLIWGGSKWSTSRSRQTIWTEHNNWCWYVGLCGNQRCC